jgi:type III pantothenate kinase
MILGFDIGNTSTSFGVYRRGIIIPFHLFRYDTAGTGDPDALEKTIRARLSPIAAQSKDEVDGFVFSSVVTGVNRAYHKVARDAFGLAALEIGCGIAMNISLNYERPEMLGPDRIVNAAAARRCCGGDCLVIDLGTATTVSVLLADGTFDGGIIAPGVGITMEALSKKTSKLVEVPLEAPPSIVGHNTADCIKSGFFHGWASMMEGFVAKISALYGREFTVVLTGGFSRRFAGHLDFPCVIDPLLTMKGIKILFDINRP